jgi:hypothetical protein
MPKFLPNVIKLINDIKDSPIAATSKVAAVLLSSLNEVFATHPINRLAQYLSILEPIVSEPSIDPTVSHFTTRHATWATSTDSCPHTRLTRHTARTARTWNRICCVRCCSSSSRRTTANRESGTRATQFSLSAGAPNGPAIS